LQPQGFRRKRRLCSKAGRISLAVARPPPPAFYFCCGVEFRGEVGWDCVCEGFTPDSTDEDPVRRAAKIESVIDVTIKIIADQVVARDRTEAAPRGPNAVWLP